MLHADLLPFPAADRKASSQGYSQPGNIPSQSPSIHHMKGAAIRYIKDMEHGYTSLHAFKMQLDEYEVISPIRRGPSGYPEYESYTSI